MTYTTRDIKYPDDKSFMSGILDKYLKFRSGAVQSIEWNYEMGLSDSASGKILVFSSNDSTQNVGSLNVLKREFLINKKRYKVSLFGDFVVEAGHRTLAPAIKLSKEAVNSGLKDSVFVYGFPNAKAFPVLKMSGFKSIGMLTRYAYVVRYSKYLPRIFNLPVVPFVIGFMIDLVRNSYSHFSNIINIHNARIEEIFEFDLGVDKLIKSSSYNSLICNTRTSDYLNWRYFKNPQQTYTVLSCYGGGDGNLTGYVVLEKEDDVIHIRDLLAINNSFNDILLKAVKEFALSGNYTVISFSFFGSESVNKLLKKSGFMPRESVRHLVIKSNERESLSCLYDKNNWYVVDGDEDQ